MIALVGRGMVTLVEQNNAVAMHTAGATISALWDNFRAGVTTGPVGDRVAVAAAGALVLVAQLGKLVSLAGGLLLTWEIAQFIGEKVGIVQTVERNGGTQNANQQKDG